MASEWSNESRPEHFLPRGPSGRPCTHLWSYPEGVSATPGKAVFVRCRICGYEDFEVVKPFHTEHPLA